jgi:uncharacterized protein (DUF2267 family)
MDELVQQVKSRVNLSDEQARQAVETVLQQLRQHLPDPIGQQLDELLRGNKSLSDLGDLGGMMGSLGGMFGG